MEFQVMKQYKKFRQKIPLTGFDTIEFIFIFLEIQKTMQLTQIKNFFPV